MNIKLTISYDGAPFFGFQKTKEGPSVEEHLEKALEKVLKKKVFLQAASRTDRGVHAKGQVVNFQSTSIPSLSLLNTRLREEIRIIKIEKMQETFHPTLDSKGKAYHYLVTNHPFQLPFERAAAWHFPYKIDLNLLTLAAKKCIGTHDFSGLCNQIPSLPQNKIRTLTKCEIIPTKDRLEFVIEGHSFLYKMVRNIVGTLLYIGAKKIDLDQLFQVKGMTAPAHGLTLKTVYY
ncbi:MAG: tRNA pseudouridine(38-40) synthase TruA [Simkaniaceae bacterium]|nr:tRNA pseudouridine(38-40) synthase TruA [Simkaniaceae bacterium]